MFVRKILFFSGAVLVGVIFGFMIFIFSKEIFGLNINVYYGIMSFLVLFLPVIPKKYADPLGYLLDKERNIPSMPHSIMKYLIRQISYVFEEFAITIGLKGSVTVLMFIAVGVDFYYNKSISNATLVIIIVAIISLYLEFLVANADEIEFFKIFKYKRRVDNKR